MKILFSLASALLISIGSSSVQAADKVALQLRWVTQAQFAGYYVALEQGFYKKAGLDVTIKPGGPDIRPTQVIMNGGADVIVDWMSSALASREQGVPLVNIAQPFEKSGLMLTCRKDSGVSSPADFRGKTLGVWFAGSEYPFLSWMSELGLSVNGGSDGVTILKQGYNVDPLIHNKAACISTMSYNEYWQLIDSGMSSGELVVFRYEDQGVSTLEDGLYVLEKNLNDPAFFEKMVRFVKASMEGWRWALDHQERAVDIVLRHDLTGKSTRKHQLRMLSEIGKLIGDSNGRLKSADYRRTVDILLSGGSSPVITKEPTGAWTHKVVNVAGL